MNIQLTPSKIAALLKTLLAWVGLVISVTDTIPALHSVRPTILACSSILLAIEHGIYKMNGPSSTSKGSQP